MTLLFDTRERDPHPWAHFLPQGWTVEHGTLETGDISLARLPEGVVIERKTAPDLAACIGRERERFERELKRSRYVGRFLVVCEGTLADVCRQARGISAASVLGSIAAWSVRFCPFVFAGDTATAAAIAFRALAAQVRDISRPCKALAAGAQTKHAPRSSQAKVTKTFDEGGY
jgi:DNA excision repair protein ERCC-4